jgi:hypothetical protein
MKLDERRGAALVSVMVLAAVLVPIGAWVALQARIDGALARNLRADLHAFYVADAGMSHALSVVSRAPSAAVALAGPDGLAGTTDDGGILGVPADHVTFPKAPYGYAVGAQAAGTDGIRLQSVGLGWDGATRQLEALVYWRAGKTVVWWREVL